MEQLSFSFMKEAKNQMRHTISEEASARGRATLAAKFLRLRVSEYPKSKSYKVNKYVRFAAERLACENHLKELQYQMTNRMNALSGGQLGEARRLLEGGPVGE